MRDNAKGGALTEVTFFILLSLFSKNHGYGIMQFVESMTNGRLVLGAGSLYGAINTLLEKKWIEPTDNGTGRKKEYIITQLGKEIVDLEIIRLNSLLITAREIVGGEQDEKSI